MCPYCYPGPRARHPQLNAFREPCTPGNCNLSHGLPSPHRSLWGVSSGAGGPRGLGRPSSPTINVDPVTEEEPTSHRRRDGVPFGASVRPGSVRLHLGFIDPSPPTPLGPLRPLPPTPRCRPVSSLTPSSLSGTEVPLGSDYLLRRRKCL